MGERGEERLWGGTGDRRRSGGGAPLPPIADRAAAAAPATLPSAVNLMRWTCGIPGRPGTDWAGGVYPLTIEFSDDYPAKPPKVCATGGGWRRGWG